MFSDKRMALLHISMIILSNKRFLVEANCVINSISAVGKLIAFLKRNNLLGTVYRYRLKNSVSLKCPYCGAPCTHYGYAYKIIVSPEDDRLDLFFLPRCQCTNSNCVCRIKRDEAKTKSRYEETGIYEEYTGNNVTHVVFPDTLVPFERYPSFVIEIIALLRIIRAKDFLPGASQASLETDERVVNLKEFCISSFINYTSQLLRTKEKKILRANQPKKSVTSYQAEMKAVLSGNGSLIPLFLQIPTIPL